MKINEKDRSRAQDRIEILLNEYRACHMNRDNYTRIRWSVGSIFLAASIALIGISISQGEKIRDIEIISLMIISVFLFLVWHIYNNRILSIYTMMSIRRMHQIERQLRIMRLHRDIYAFQKKNTKWKGQYIVLLFWGTLYFSWIFRFHIFVNRIETFDYCLMICGVLFLAIILAIVIFDTLFYSPVRKIKIRQRYNKD